MLHGNAPAPAAFLVTEAGSCTGASLQVLAATAAAAQLHARTPGGLQATNVSLNARCFLFLSSFVFSGKKTQRNDYKMDNKIRLN